MRLFIVLPHESNTLDPAAFALLITRVASIAEKLTKTQLAEKLEALVELLIDEIETPAILLQEAQMIATARQEVLSSSRWLTAAQLSKIAGFSATNPSVQPNKWKTKKQTFAVQIKGIDFFPEYTLNPHENYRPAKVLSEIIEIFGNSKDSWSLAYWFAGVNANLSGQRQQDLVLANPTAVLEAAKVELAGISHY